MSTFVDTTERKDDCEKEINNIYVNDTRVNIYGKHVS